MLIEFGVENFGSIKNKQTLSFEATNDKHLEDYYVIPEKITKIKNLRLLKIGLIYGANASGKTTILKALDFLRTLTLNPKSQRTETFDFEPFKFDKNTPLQNTVFSISFIQNGIRYDYSVELNKNCIVKESLFSFNPKKSNVFTRITDEEKQFTKIDFGSKINIDKITKQTFETVTLWNNTALGGFLKTNVAINELKNATDWFENYFSELLVTNLQIKDFLKYSMNISELRKNKKIIVNILKKADFNIADLHIKETSKVNDFFNLIFKNIGLQNEMKDLQNTKYAKIFEETTMNLEQDLPQGAKIPQLEFEHIVDGNLYNLEIDFESLGTQRYFVMACVLIMLINNSKLILIDELESSLHPDLFMHFLLSFLANSKQSQIIATTHNREILKDRDIFRTDAIWITDKDNKECATELYSIADFDSSVIRKDTASIYNAYKIGKLGGTPNVGDYYIDMDDNEKT